MSTTLTPAHGTEAEVCADIARRQLAGMNKYGTSVADNPLSLREWQQHAYEEALDLAVYLKRIFGFDAPSPVTEPEFRFFRDPDGTRYKMPVNGDCGWCQSVSSGEWWQCGGGIAQIEESIKRHGTIETDADGNTLVDTSAGNPVNIERPANRCNFYDPNPFGEVATEQPAKAREWQLIANGPSVLVHAGPKLKIGEAVNVREVRADEAGLLEEKDAQISQLKNDKYYHEEQINLLGDFMDLLGTTSAHIVSETVSHIEKLRRQRDEAVGHLRLLANWDGTSAGTLHFDAEMWLRKHFPEPKPEADENGWLPISCFDIKDKRSVLVYCSERKNTYTAYRESGIWFHLAAGLGKLTEEPTEWQPKPQPPIQRQTPIPAQS